MQGYQNTNFLIFCFITTLLRYAIIALLFKKLIVNVCYKTTESLIDVLTLLFRAQVMVL